MPNILWSTPFVLLLLAIALLPLVPVAHHWWERNSIKLLVGLVLSAVVLAHYGFRGYGAHGAAPGAATVLAVLEHAILRDFVPFLILLFSLYVIAGGLQLKGDLPATPAVNTAMLGVGALLASLIGTTGASMVLIRPLLQTNRDREHVRHTVVFFIFLVSNIGGCLLPTRRPAAVPGLPERRAVRLDALPGQALALLRRRAACRSISSGTSSPIAARPRSTWRPTSGTCRRLRLHGTINLLWLLGVVLAVALIVPGRPLPGTDIVVRDFVREGVLLGLTGLSLATTPRGLRKDTEFSHAAIIEVGCLFFGIFLTMQVPIEILQARGRRAATDHAVALLLGDRVALELPRQRADLSRLLRDGHDRSPRPGTRGWSTCSAARSARTCSRRSRSGRSSWAPTPTSATPRT